MDVYLVGVSFAGITVAALTRLFNLQLLKPITRMAELLTIISLLLAGIIILVDLGQPGRGIINLFQYARPMSAFFGTFALVIAGYLFASLVYFYLDGRRDAAIHARRLGRWQWFHRLWAAGYRDTESEKERHRHVSWWLALAILPILVIAHSTLGLVFGVQAGRPGWYSALQAPGFVILAGVSGMGLIIVIAGIMRTVRKFRERLPLKTFALLGNMTWVLAIAYIYFIIVEILVATYASGVAETAVTTQLLSGSYAPIFWGATGLIVLSFGLLFGQFARHRYSIGLIVTSGILLNLAALGKRFLIVAPSLTDGNLLPYGAGIYTPSWVEYSIILGTLALGALTYALFIKVFPIMSAQESTKEAGDA
jgi:molybdopterin-containing oxidoreductase family membrane subunit